MLGAGRRFEIGERLFIGLKPGMCNGRYFERLRIKRSDPGDPKAAMPDSDTAGLVEQFLAVAHAHDQRVDAARDRLDPAEAGNLLFLFDMLERERDVIRQLGEK